MKLKKIEIHGFGKLTDLRFELSPQLNLFWGLNEAGKSTLQQAILALLYGFYQGARASPKEREEHEWFRPWQAQQFGGSLSYQLDDGREFEILRDFKTSDVPTRVVDPLTGKDFTATFGTKRHGNVPAARQHLGMSREIFLSTAFMRQAQVRQLQPGKLLIGEIVSLLDTGSLDRTAQNAIQVLEKKIQEIGGERAFVRPLQKARARLAKLKAEKAQWEEARQGLHTAAVEKQRLERELESDLQKLMEYQYLIAIKKKELLGGQLMKLGEAEGQLRHWREKAESLKAFAKFDDSGRDTLLKRTETLKGLQEQFQKIIAEKKQSEEILTEFRAKLEKLQPFVQLAERLPLEEFQNLRSRWEVMQQSCQNTRQELADQEVQLAAQGLSPEHLQPFQSLSDAVREEIKQRETQGQALATELAAVQQEEAAVRLRRSVGPVGQGVILVAAVLLSAGLFILGFAHILEAGRILGFVPLLLGGGLFFYYQRRWHRWQAELAAILSRLQTLEAEKMQLENSLQESLRPYGAARYSELLEKENRFKSYQQKWQAFQKAKEDSKLVELQLLKHLELLEIKEITGEKLVEVQQQFREVNQLVAEIDGQTKRFQELQREMVRVNDQIEASKSSLRQLYERCGIFIEDLTAAFAEYESLFAKKRQWLTCQQEMEKWEREEKGILAAKGRAELETELQEAEKQEVALLSQHPDLAGKQSTSNLQQLTSAWEQLNQARQEKDKRVERLAERIQTVMKPHRVLAEIEEELAETEREIQHLLRFRHLLERARDTIREVAEEYHRDVAPYLNQAVGAGIARITQERYREVRVDPSSLSLKLVVPETATLQEAEHVSLGTQEQLYLLLRLAIAQLLSERGEKIPLILDDPFGHFDHLRLQRILDFLVELSTEQQILLFCKERQVREWGEKMQEAGAARLFTLV